MRYDAIPVKTAAGLREVIRHDHALPFRSRAMLIAICGDLTALELRRRFGDMIDADSVLDQLLALGLIQCVYRDGQAPEEGVTLTPEQLARALMAEVSTVAPGLYGYLFTLRMRGCRTREQLRSLLPSYQDLLATAVDENYALKQSTRVGLLLTAT